MKIKADSKSAEEIVVKVPADHGHPNERRLRLSRINTSDMGQPLRPIRQLRQQSGQRKRSTRLSVAQNFGELD
jgi:hypothetical protein